VINMGMFDSINFKIKCSECGNVIDDFQSKDGDCLLNTLEFWEVDNFYSSCSTCNKRIEFTLKKEVSERIRKTIDELRKSLTIDDYKKEEKKFEKFVKKS